MAKIKLNFYKQVTRACDVKIRIKRKTVKTVTAYSQIHKITKKYQKTKRNNRFGRFIQSQF
jgi:5-methylcytosine-specific restriction endonuclease McrA